MRIRLMLAGLAVAGLTASTALAEDGVYAASLTRLVNDAAEGTCTAELMGEGLLKACQEQIGTLGPALKGLGAAQTVTLTKSETPSVGLVETYAVAYAGGQTLTWVIGVRHEDGKFDTLYVGGGSAGTN